MRLSTLEHGWARDVFDAMFPRDVDPRIPIGILDTDLDGFLDGVGDCWPTLGFLAVRAGIIMISLAPIFAIGRLRLFGSLPRADRVRVLSKLSGSKIYPVRGLVTILKALGGIAFGAAPEVRASLSPGRPVPLAQLSRRGAAS